jgi:hypothetical protein
MYNNAFFTTVLSTPRGFSFSLFTLLCPVQPAFFKNMLAFKANTNIDAHPLLAFLVLRSLEASG